jgi:hypothetical protein
VPQREPVGSRQVNLDEVVVLVGFLDLVTVLHQRLLIYQFEDLSGADIAEVDEHMKARELLLHLKSCYTVIKDKIALQYYSRRT